MRRFELAFLVLASCKGDEATPARSPGTDDVDGAIGGGNDSSVPSGDASTTTDGATTDANVKPLGPPRVYVGSGDGKIRVFSFDAANATLTPVQTVDSGNNPSFLAVDPEHKFLYAVDEGQSQVRSFSIENPSGKLTPVGNPIGSGSNGPAHVSVDRAGKYVMVANYSGGTLSVFPRQTDGSLGASVATRSFGGGAQTHQIITDPSNKWVLVPNKGKDAVSVFGLNANGTLTDVSLAGFTAGDGARHVDVNATSTRAYVVDELGNTVTVMSLEPNTGALASIQTVSTLEPTFTGANTTAEIQITPDGKHVIASNRGDNSLAVFDVNATDGKLTRTTRVATGGNTPRHFSIEQTGQFLFVGNQGSGNVVVMKLDAMSGVPTAVGAPLSVPSPAYVALFYL
jgi:6-phosphogluconolactonase